MALQVTRPACTEPGSPQWMEAAVKLARFWAKGTDQDVRELVKYTADLRAHDWRQFVGGKDDWGRFCRDVLGYDPGFIAEMEEGAAVLNGKGHRGKVTVGAARNAAQRMAADPLFKRSRRNGERGRGNKSYDNGIAFQKTGSNRADYIVRRLKRDAPDIAKALGRGEYPSARAAGIAAGIVKVPTRLEAAKKAAGKLNARDKAALRKWLDQQEA